MKKLVICLPVLVMLSTCRPAPPAPDVICRDYVAAWANFYPTRAYAAGDRESAFRFERFGPESISAWVAVNRETLLKLDGRPSGRSPDDRTDARLLRRQVEQELETWARDRAPETSPALYSGLISQAFTSVLVRSDLSPQEKLRAAATRLEGIRDLCRAASTQLSDARPHAAARSAAVLDAGARFLVERLPAIAEEWRGDASLDDFTAGCRETAGAVRELAAFVRNDLSPRLSLSDAIGREAYSRKLHIYTGMELTPEAMADDALDEIREVRGLMVRLSSDILSGAGEGSPPVGEEDRVRRALDLMESHRVDHQKAFLRQFTQLVARAERFLIEKRIATPPAERTLVTDLSPAHFAGAAVGGVYAAGPFNPEADTLFYLPSVPDDAPLETREGFYRSFNNHFNTMIVPHEIYPGHYMQSKLAAGHPSKVRSLFSDALYVEGWGSLCEVIALDAGWNGFDPLDRLAHLRKRLENAVRAYVSAQVHCRGWEREQVIRFAVEEGWLAPQFALNLWDRVMASPLQLTSYFLGFRRFGALLAEERTRLGAEFRLQAFCDAVLKAGAVPLDTLPAVLSGAR